MRVFRRPSLRRLVSGVGFLLVVCLGVLTGWIWNLGTPRPEFFARPRPPIVGAELTQGDAAEQVALTAADGFVVRLAVVRDRAHDRPRPVVLLLGGHRTGRNAVQLVGEPGRLAIVAVDYPYDGPDRIRGVWQGLRQAPAVRHALLNTPRALSQAMDWVLTQPWTDPARVELVGVSLGVPFVAAAGASDTRFSRVWLIQGAADNRAWLEASLQRRIETDWLRIWIAGWLHRLAHGPTYDTPAWVAQITPRPVVIVGALEDQRLTHDQITRLYEAAGQPRELLWVSGRHINPRRPETVRPLLGLVRERIP